MERKKQPDLFAICKSSWFFYIKLFYQEFNCHFLKVYEDWSDERITESNFKMLSQKYQAEQQETEEKIARLKASMAEEKQTVADTERWINLIRQYAAPTELTADLLNTLIKKS